MNTTDTPFDYLAAIEKLRKDNKSNKTQIMDPDYIPPQNNEPVDYLAALKAWDIEQADKYKLHLHIKKENPSHDPE